MSPEDMVVRQRMSTALADRNCSEALYKLMVQLKDEGFPRVKMIKMLTSFESRHRNDQDETVYDAILLSIDAVFSSTHPRRIF